MKNLREFKPRRVLVLQQRKIGDVLLATPAIRLLRERYPDAPVDVFAERHASQVLNHNPDVDTIFRLDKKELNSTLKALAYYRRAGRGHDLVVDFQQLPRCRLVTAFSLARVRLTFTPPWYNRPYYTHWVDTLDGYAAMSKASVLRPLGIEWHGQPPRLFLAPEEREAARSLLAELGLKAGQRLVTVDPTQNDMRRWPAEHYGRLIREVLAVRPDTAFLLFYGPGEEAQVREVAAAAGDPPGLIVPPRVLGLREMAAIMDRASLHLGNCSAPRHFAAGLDLPSLIVLGATSPAWRFPSPIHRDVFKGLPCQPCNAESCQRGQPCLKELSVEETLPAFLEHFDEHGRGPLTEV